MSYYPNRYFCTVLDEMRKLNETRNFSPLISLIEELQILGNRMEAGLADKRDIKRISEELSKLKAKRKELLKEVEKLEKKTGKKSEEKKNE